jgi:HD superfamily phosphohydrolase
VAMDPLPDDVLSDQRPIHDAAMFMTVFCNYSVRHLNACILRGLLSRITYELWIYLHEISVLLAFLLSQILSSLINFIKKK